MVTEALLEMHYHSALVDLFAETFGARFLRLIKPSPQKEAWVGFDQGWVRTELRDLDFLRTLQESINGSEGTPSFYLAYFLQFKVVQCMERRSEYCPQNFDVPYFRSEISLKPNFTTGLSQHETLLRLSALNRSDVVYACPMMFSAGDVYDDADLETLRIVPVSDSPRGWHDEERHFICFQSKQDDHPTWMSEPHHGSSMSCAEWVRSYSREHRFGGEQLLEFLETVRSTVAVNKPQMPERRRVGLVSAMPLSFTILQFGIVDGKAV